MAAKSGQKTINLGHVQGALDAIGFGDWCDPLKRRLDRNENEVSIKHSPFFRIYGGEGK